MIRDRVIHARVSPDEKILAERVAEAQRVGVSEAIRLVLRREGERLGIWPPDQAGGVQTQAEGEA